MYLGSERSEMIQLYKINYKMSFDTLVELGNSVEHKTNRSHALPAGQ